MKRKKIEELIKWKERSEHKPLIIQGARQTGKTWLMKEFGKQFAQCIYINFEDNEAMKELFQGSLSPDRLLMGIELYANQKIDIQHTLLIFDEVQEVPRALTSLKYFNEEAPEVYIVCAGSLLGIALHQGTSFPVGKVEFMELYPMSFVEFLMAMGKESLANLLESHDESMISAFHEQYIDLLKQYYYVGGMPEVVSHYAQHQDIVRVREIQKQILTAYEQDFSKHAPSELVPRLRMLWNSIPAQLAKENKKFIYGLIREGARAKEYELALLWLQDCGLVHKVHRINSAKLPLKAYQDEKAFKLFTLDVGLLSCMCELHPSTLLRTNELFVEFKGALSEQFVLQQLITTLNSPIYYWSNEKGSAELDFIIQLASDIIPIEVKAEQNLKAKSLKVYYDKFQPRRCIRTSMAKLKKESWLTNLPLYAISELTTYGTETS